MNFSAGILLILLLSYIAVKTGKRTGIPPVVSLILTGIIMGAPFFKGTFIKEHKGLITVFGDAGLIALMFLAGLESSWRLLYKERRDAALIAAFAAFIPFLLGLTAFLLMGFSLTVSLAIGICMAITAEATKAKVLLDMGKLKTRVGSAMMGAGIIDDIIGFCLFLITVYLIHNSASKEDILIIVSMAAFFFGILIQKFIKRRHAFLKYPERFLNYAIVPFFFISMGIHFEMETLFIDPRLLLIIIAIAVTGKLAGALLVKPFSDFSWKQLYLIGWGMNSRGAVELALALIAYKSGLMPLNLFSSLVIMVLVTTLAFPFVFKVIVRNNSTIMD